MLLIYLGFTPNTHKDLSISWKSTLQDFFGNRYGEKESIYHKWRGITCTNDQDKLFQMAFLGQFRGSHPEMFLVKGVVKIWSKFTGEHATLLKSPFGMGVFL